METAAGIAETDDSRVQAMMRQELESVGFLHHTGLFRHRGGHARDARATVCPLVLKIRTARTVAIQHQYGVGAISLYLSLGVPRSC